MHGPLLLVLGVAIAFAVGVFVQLHRAERSNREHLSETFYWATNAEGETAGAMPGLPPGVPRGDAIELTSDEARAVQEIIQQQQAGQLTGDEAQAALGAILQPLQERQRATETHDSASDDDTNRT